MNKPSSTSKRTHHASDRKEDPFPSPTKQIRIDLTRIKTFACPSCNCIFHSSAKLAIHQNFAHLNWENELPCDVGGDVHRHFAFENTESFPTQIESQIQDTENLRLKETEVPGDSIFSSRTLLNDHSNSSTEVYRKNSTDLHHQPEVPADSHEEGNVIDLSCERSSQPQLVSRDDPCRLQPTHSTLIPPRLSENSCELSGGEVQLNSNATLPSQQVIYRFGCSACGCIFDTLELLAIHKSTKHGARDQAQDQKASEKSKPAQDQEIISIENHECSICGLILGSSLNYQIHMNFHITASANPELKCSTCSRQFLTVTGLESHRKHHANTNVEVLPVNSEPIRSVSANPVSVSEVPPPPEVATTIASQKRPEHSTSKKRSIRHEGIQQCLLCKKAFSGRRSRYSLTQHLNRMHLFVCIVCKLQCKSQEDLRTHEVSTHPQRFCRVRKEPEVFPFICPECSIGFQFKMELEDHVRVVHPVYQCCGTVFTSKAKYDLHTSLHTFSNSGARNSTDGSRTASTAINSTDGNRIASPVASSASPPSASTSTYERTTASNASTSTQRTRILPTAKVAPISVLRPRPRLIAPKINTGNADQNMTAVEPRLSNSGSPAAIFNLEDQIAINTSNVHCYLCGSGFERPLEVVEHIRLIHPNVYARNATLFVNASSPTIQDPYSELANPCVILSKSVQNPLLARLLDRPVIAENIAHGNTNHDKSSAAESLVSNPEPSKSPTEKTNSNVFKCELCEATFRSNSEMIVHIGTIHLDGDTTVHTSQKPSSSDVVPNAPAVLSCVPMTVTEEVLLKSPEHENSSLNARLVRLESPAPESNISDDSSVEILSPPVPNIASNYNSDKEGPHPSSPGGGNGSYEDGIIQTSPVTVESPVAQSDVSDDSSVEILSSSVRNLTSNSNLSKEGSHPLPEGDNSRYEDDLIQPSPVRVESPTAESNVDDDDDSSVEILSPPLPNVDANSNFDSERSCSRSPEGDHSSLDEKLIQPSPVPVRVDSPAAESNISDDSSVEILPQPNVRTISDFVSQECDHSIYMIPSEDDVLFEPTIVFKDTADVEVVVDPIISVPNTLDSESVVSKLQEETTDLSTSTGGVLPPDVDATVVHSPNEDNSDLNSLYDFDFEDCSKSTTSRSVVESFGCMICPARFACQEEFKEHEELHLKAVLANRSGGLRFKCAFCPLAFFREAGLSEHLKVAHFGSETRFVSEIWNNRFKLIANLQQRITETRQTSFAHILHIHSDGTNGATCSADTNFAVQTNCDD